MLKASSTHAGKFVSLRLGRVHCVFHKPVADSGGVRGVQVDPPLEASNVFLRTYLYESIK